MTNSINSEEHYPGSLLDIINYIDLYKNSEINSDISFLSKILYLIDWKACIVYGKQCTQLEWTNSNYGPTCDRNLGLSYDLATRVKKYERNSNQELSTAITTIIDFIIEKTEHMKYTDFAHLVHSTYPMVTSEKYQVLNLPELAKEYNIYKKEGL
jgi:hypothetical protein